MADHPILFSGPMIRALREGRKSQTRRVLKPQPPEDFMFLGLYAPRLTAVFEDKSFAVRPDHAVTLPHLPGDRLWVREAFNTFTFSEDGEEAWPTDTIPTAEEMREIKEAAYRYDTQVVYRESDRARKWFGGQKWRPSTQMPRWASRLTLTVTDVRVQRVWDIEWSEVKAEGLDPYDQRFSDLWNSLHGPDAWDRNDWVTATTFNVHHCNIDRMEAAHG